VRCLLQGVSNLGINLFDVAQALYFVQQVLFLVIGEQTFRILMIKAQAIADNFFAIVFPLNEVDRVKIANAIIPGRIIAEVIGPLTLRTAQTARHAVYDFFIIDAQKYNGRQIHELLPQDLIEGDRLGHGARVAVGDEALRPIRAAEALRDHVIDQIIGSQPAARDVGRHDFSQRSLLAYRFTQNVPRSDVDEAESLTQKFGLRAFAASGGANEDQSHHKPNSKDGETETPVCLGLAVSLYHFRNQSGSQQGGVQVASLEPVFPYQVKTTTSSQAHFSGPAILV
jgi:hypothetical protein